MQCCRGMDSLTDVMCDTCRRFVAVSALCIPAPSWCWLHALRWLLVAASPQSASSSTTHHQSWWTGWQQQQVSGAASILQQRRCCRWAKYVGSVRCPAAISSTPAAHIRWAWFSVTFNKRGYIAVDVVLVLLSCRFSELATSWCQPPRHCRTAQKVPARPA